MNKSISKLVEAYKPTTLLVGFFAVSLILTPATVQGWLGYDELVNSQAQQGQVLGTTSATYYVAANGSDSNTGTITAPFATINKAVSMAVAGDIIYIRGGNYYQTVSVSKSGTASAPITIAGYPGETAVVDGQNKIPANVYSFLFSVPASYVKVQDLIVRNSYGGAVALSGNYNSITNVEVDGAGETGIVLSGNYNIARGVNVHGNGKAYGVYSTTWGGALCVAYGTGNVIENSVSHDNVGEGLASYGGASGTIIQDNISYNNQSLGIYTDSTTNVTVRRNLVYYTVSNPARGIVIGHETSPMPSDITIVNNFVLGARLNLDVDSNVTSLNNVVIANNTFVNTVKTASDISSGYNMSLYIRSSVTSFSGSVFKNNIVQEDDTRQVMITVPPSYTGTGLTFSNNLWSRTPPSKVSGSGDIIANSQLAKIGAIASGALTGDYFKLLSSSPAINKGIALYQVVDDYFKTTRPQSSAYDIGGHEYAGTVAGDTQAPTVPANLSATAVSSSQINLSWTASADNIGVTGYKIYRNGNQVGTIAANSYSDTVLAANTTYSYTVSAYDAVGNTSSQSTAASATTQSAVTQAVTSYTLVNADTDTDIMALPNSATLNLATLPTRILNIRVNTSPTIVGSVVVFYDGVIQPMQNTVPYAAFDDNAGDYYPWIFTVGTHILKATPYSAANGTGTAGTPLQINFTVMDTDTQAPTVPANLSATVISSSQINLSWTASTDNVGVSGYNIFRNGTKVTTVTSSSYADTNLSPATTYSYTVSAYDAIGNTSAQSVSALVTTLPTIDTTPPLISSIKAGSITTNSAVISWTTDKPSSSFVDYGLSASYGSTLGDSTLTTTHNVVLVNLSSASTYHFRVKSTDASGNTAISLDNSFTTTVDPSQNQAPAAITNLSAAQPTRSSIVLKWTTSGSNGNSGTASSYDIRYANVPITESTWNTANQATGEPLPKMAGATQSYTLVGLTPGTKYYAAIKATNSQGLTSSLSNVISFSTKTRAK